jgi:uncharacterized protein with GYD domain
MGGKFHAWYLALGQYDGVLLEAPNDDIAQWALALGRGGNVSTETLRLFTDDEFKKMITAAPRSFEVRVLGSSSRKP